MSVDTRQSNSRVDTMDLDRRVLRRGAVAILLFGIAVVHLLDVQGKLQEVPYIGVMFIILILSSLVLAELLIRTDYAGIWVAAGSLAGLTVVGYIVSRTSGLPGDDGSDIGNWFEPLGLVSLLICVVVICSAAVRLTERPKH